jgi:hypothetical protein
MPQNHLRQQQPKQPARVHKDSRPDRRTNLFIQLRIRPGLQRIRRTRGNGDQVRKKAHPSLDAAFVP